MAETRWCSCNPLREAQEKAEKWDAIVRCKDCRHFKEARLADGSIEYRCSGVFAHVKALHDGFCSWGVRK